MPLGGGKVAESKRIPYPAVDGRLSRSRPVAYPNRFSLARRIDTCANYTEESLKFVANGSHGIRAQPVSRSDLHNEGCGYLESQCHGQLLLSGTLPIFQPAAPI